MSILLLALEASNPSFHAPLLRAATAKSLNEFGSCFTRVEEQDARAWAFMPTGEGGVFTNSGASGVAAPYWLQVSEARPLNHLRLFVASGSTDSAELLQAVDRCR